MMGTDSGNDGAVSRVYCVYVKKTRAAMLNATMAAGSLLPRYRFNNGSAMLLDRVVCSVLNCQRGCCRRFKVVPGSPPTSPPTGL